MAFIYQGYGYSNNDMFPLAPCLWNWYFCSLCSFYAHEIIFIAIKSMVSGVSYGGWYFCSIWSLVYLANSYEIILSQLRREAIFIFWFSGRPMYGEWVLYVFSKLCEWSFQLAFEFEQALSYNLENEMALVSDWL